MTVDNASENAATENAASENAASENAASENAASENAASENAASENAATENAASENDAPTLRQKLHAATGDREAEAKALADRADDVDEDAALDAVRKAHGDLGPGQPGPESDLATRADAKVADQD